MSNESRYIELLHETIDELKHARHWLGRSADKCRDIDAASKLSEDQYDDLEAYMSRFAGASDLLIQKVFRADEQVP
jgi:ClpP class serine protease